MSERSNYWEWDSESQVLSPITPSYDFIWNDTTYQSLVTELETLLGSSEKEGTFAGIVAKINGLLDEIKSEDNWSGPSRNEYVEKWGNLGTDLNNSVEVIRNFIKLLKNERNKYIEDVIDRIYHNEYLFYGFVSNEMTNIPTTLKDIQEATNNYISSIGTSNYVEYSNEEV